MQFQRSHRIGESIHKEISALLVKGLKDPRIADFVTITAVEVTPDLHLARVYFTVMGDDQARKDTATGLQHAVPHIRRELGRRLHMRYVPDLLFHYDKSLEYGSRIDALLEQVKSEQDDDRDDSDEN